MNLTRSNSETLTTNSLFRPHRHRSTKNLLCASEQSFNHNPPVADVWEPVLDATMIVSCLLLRPTLPKNKIRRSEPFRCRHWDSAALGRMRSSADRTLEGENKNE